MANYGRFATSPDEIESPSNRRSSARLRANRKLRLACTSEVHTRSFAFPSWRLWKAPAPLTDPFLPSFIFISSPSLRECRTVSDGQPAVIGRVEEFLVEDSLPAGVVQAPLAPPTLAVSTLADTGTAIFGLYRNASRVGCLLSAWNTGGLRNITRPSRLIRPVSILRGMGRRRVGRLPMIPAL